MTHPLDNAKVGDGATYTIYTDRLAGTIIKRTPTKIIWQRDKAVLLNGAQSGEPDALTFTPGGFCGHTSGTQRYSYERDEAGQTETFSRRVTKSGKVRWKLSGTDKESPGSYLSEGRHEHYDFNY